MFFSINNELTAKVNDDLKTMVLGKLRRGLELKKHRYSIFILSGALARQAGVSGILNTNTGSSRILSELSWPPFGYIWEMDPKVKSAENSRDISFFATDFDYDKTATALNLKIPVLEVNTQFPGDYRTRKEVFEQHIKNKYARMQQDFINNNR
jgi:hypothetical protein